MSSENTITITSGGFDKLVNDSADPILVDFWAPWCPPCNALTPTIDKLADRFDGKAVVGKVNVDEEQALAQKFSVQSIPTILVLQGGDVKARFVGVQSEDTLAKAIEDATQPVAN